MTVINFDVWGAPGEEGVQTLNPRPEAVARREVVDFSRDINEEMLGLRLIERVEDMHPVMNGMADLNLHAFVGDVSTPRDWPDGDSVRFMAWRPREFAGDDTVPGPDIHGMGYWSVIAVPSKDSE